MRRKERLAEELRANLKRRKAAACRHKEAAAGEEDTGSLGDEGLETGNQLDEREA